ncbi:alkaline phosphatase D family protein [Novosphingobium sp. MBES04]|uniref:alkaline phosphatase D family protein n=1 Tax=Novosphingobium sp. MBES04 TaxID=1206458 RepID=UPI00057C7B0D|nr:alkaline phosphatase D family protein [Novosphingobium sp. MBES04]GAM03698.1 alkaline phosphatase [Novosphingobium sp. MBES04]
MPLTLDRRLLIQGSLLGLGALALPGLAQAMTAQGFTHGVASGEPSGNSVLLWTRYVGSGATKLRCEVAADEAFTKVISGGEVIASPEHDNCAKLVVKGLAPDRWYHYRFIAPDGSMSEIGRTRTLPTGNVARFGIGLFSCSNMPFGFFNAYAHAARRDDLDLVIHVGDYLYEYAPNGSYPATAMAGREVQPDHEILTLADYRLRYASYRLDPDLQALHRRFPMLAQWDDHELANDAWQGGAENHQSETEGSWSARRAIAERVYREWMPVSDTPYNSFQIGSLATIFRPETRVTGRVEQLDFAKALAGKDDIARAMIEFRDGAWQDPARTVMGATQEKWLNREIAQSVKSGTRWQVLAQQIVMGPLKAPAEMADIAPNGADPKVRQALMGIAAASKVGLPFNMDSWDGYPAARERLLRAAREAEANLVVLSGDSHNAWGQNLSVDGAPVGVEYAGHSVTSPGFESYLPSVAPQNLARALQGANPGLSLCDASRRGYVSLDLTQDSVRGAWHFMSTIAARTTSGTTQEERVVNWGTRAFAAV